MPLSEEERIQQLRALLAAAEELQRQTAAVIVDITDQVQRAIFLRENPVRPNRDRRHQPR